MKKHRSYSEQLAEFAVNLKFSDIPAAVVEKMKLHFIDALGVALAGTMAASPRQIVEVSESLGGPPESSIIGSLKRVSTPNAAMANSALIHSLDFDDTHLGAHAHISSFVVPTALAVAEQLGANGKATIVAAVAGAEVGSRIGLACQYNPNNKGIHATSFISPFGAAIVAGQLMGLSSNDLAMALGIAGSLSGGLLQGNVEGTQLKVFHPPWGCHGGILAARLAHMGFKGPKQVFEGVYGIYNAFFSPEFLDGGKLIGKLGQVWETSNIAFKFYPGGHGIHYFLESIRDLRQKGLRASEIDEIVLVINEFRKHAHFSEVKYRPPDGYSARFSMPYMIARIMLDGELGLDSYDADKLVQREVLDLAGKVTYVISPDAMDPRKVGTIVIRKKDGSSLEYRTKGIRGTPQRPAERKDVREKFLSNATRSISRDAAEQSLQMLEHLDELGDVAGLIKSLRVES